MTSTATTFFRATTTDLRSPIQGGPPIWDGQLPHTLPRVDVDTSGRECAAGWNACARLEDAIRLSSEWPDGRPSRLWRLTPVEGCPVLRRGDRCRAASWTILGEVSPEKARAARLRLYSPMAGEGLTAEELVAEVEAWRAALARPRHDPAAVEAGLRVTLDARGLEWTLRKYEHALNALNAWDAWDAWVDRNATAARAAMNSWDSWATRDVWDSWAIWDARTALAAREAMDSWDSWTTSDDWAARDAWDARAALTVLVAARRGWTSHRPDLLTVGIRESYSAGLALALPTAPNELGWAMEDQTRELAALATIGGAPC